MNIIKNNITQNLINVNERILEAAYRAKRNPNSIRLVAVSKGHSLKAIHQVLASNHFIFGENYLQEAVKKIVAVGPGGASWHFIGHLQSNKSKEAVRYFDIIQTIHNINLAKKINNYAFKQGKILSILLQINFTNEDKKNGCIPSEAFRLAQNIVKLPSLCLKGLMTMASYNKKLQETRQIFISLRKLAEKLTQELPQGSMSELSMGMSHDYQIAIEEGATLIRLGTAIFGPQ